MSRWPEHGLRAADDRLHLIRASQSGFVPALSDLGSLSACLQHS